MNAVTRMEDHTEAPSLPALVTPYDMVTKAVMSGASLEVVGRLMDLNDRWEAGKARKAFDAAISNAKGEIPTIGKNRTGHNDTRYADFAAYAAVIDPIIARHGLSYRFRTTQNERISVTCILSHRDGHSEENTLSGPSDKTGSKNDIQAIGSTLTYLQRYLLVQALGLAASNDDDGKKAGAAPVEFVSEQQVSDLMAALAETGANLERFLKHIKLEKLEDIHANKFAAVMAIISDTAATRKTQTGGAK